MRRFGIRGTLWLISCLFGLISWHIQAQELTPSLVCGSDVRYAEALRRLHVTQEEVEAQLKRLIEAHKKPAETQAWAFQNSEEILRVPLVFHVLYAEEYKDQTGQGGNLSAAQITTQVEELNKHFRHTHAYTDDVVSAFSALAVDTKITFGLAQKDTLGLPTNGITRAFIPSPYKNQNGNILDIETLILTQWSPLWDPERYLNIYIIPKKHMSPLSGYADYPLANILGLSSTSLEEDEGGINQTDYTTRPPAVFIADDIIHNTTTNIQGTGLVHEIGHALGLIHPWGNFNSNTGCTYDDYCEDTPMQSGSTYTTNCSGLGNTTSWSSCGSLDMMQNYMNASINCLALFTPCQKARMRAVLQGSYQRKSLLTSGDRLTPPTAFRTDSVRVIGLYAPTNVCKSASTYALDVEVANFGTSTLSAFEVAAYIGNTQVATQSITNQSIAQWARHRLTLSDIPRSSTNHKADTLWVRITSIGGTAIDSRYRSDYSLSKPIYFPAQATSLPIQEDFEHISKLTQHWIPTPEAQEILRTDARTGKRNKALVFPFNELSDSNKGIGYAYTLYSPILNLSASNSTMPVLRIPYSYTPKRGHFLSGLYITVSENPCDAEISRDIKKFKSGADIASSWYSHSGSLADSTEWRYLVLPLGDWEGSGDIQIGLHALYGGGNPIYIDDLTIEEVVLSGEQTRVESLILQNRLCITPTQLADSYTTKWIADVHNFTARTQLGFQLIIVERHTPTYKYSTYTVNKGIALQPQTQTRVTDSHFPTQFGLHTYSMWYEGDGVPDTNGNLNYDTTYYATHLVNSKSIKTTFPLDYDFSQSSTDWVAHLAGTSKDRHYSKRWQRHSASNEHYLKGSFYQSKKRDTYLLSSPIVNYASQDKVFLHFDISYAERIGHTGLGERLRVLVLKDSCSVYSGEVVWDKAGTALATAPSTANEWTPTMAHHWRQISLDLSDYTKRGPIQVLFLATNNGGNSLYLDNVGFGAGQLTGMALNPAQPTIAHRTAPNTVVASLSATHTGIGSEPNITYSVLNSTQKDTFIVENAKLKTNKRIDYNLLNGSYTFRLRAAYSPNSGAHLFTDTTLTFPIQPPTPALLAINLSTNNLSVNHGTQAGQVIATLSTIHEAIGNNPTITYEIVGGTNQDTFIVENNTLKTNKPINFFILNNTKALTLRAKHTLAGQSTLQIDKSITIRIQPPPRAITGIRLQPAKPILYHGNASGLRIAVLSATHQRIGADPNITYSIPNWTNQDTLKIENNSLKINKTINKSILGDSYTFTLRATYAPAGQTPLQLDKSITLSVQYIPAIINITVEPAAPVAYHGMASNTSIATIAAKYQNIGDNPNITYHIDGWVDFFTFKVVGNQLRTNTSIDYYELSRSYAYTLVATHRRPGKSTLSYRKNITISIQLPPAITGIQLQPQKPTLAHGTLKGVNVATISATHQNLGNNPSITFAILNPNTKDTLTIDNNKLKTNKIIDAEKLNKRYTFTLRASHVRAGKSTIQFQKNFTIAISPPPPPTPTPAITGIQLQPQSPTLAHGTQKGANVATIAATHQNLGNSPNITFAILNSNTKDTLTIESNTLKTNKIIDANKLNKSYTFTLRASHVRAGKSTLQFQKVFTISISPPPPPAPAITGIQLQPQSPTLAHGTQKGANVATIAATHQNLGNNPSITFAILNPNTKDTLIVENNTLKTNKIIDAEKLNKRYTFTLKASHVRAGKSTIQFQKNFTIAISRPPPPTPTPAITDIQLQPQSPTLAHGTQKGVNVATISATHQNLGNNPNITFAILNPNTKDTLTIESNKLKTNKIIDAGKLNKSYTFTLKASHARDGKTTLQFQKNFTIAISPPPPPTPAITDIQLQPQSPTLAHGTLKGVNVATLSATHQNLGNNPNITFAILNPNTKDTLTIESNKLKTNKIIDANKLNKRYTFTLKASHERDGKTTLQFQKNFTIAISPPPPPTPAITDIQLQPQSPTLAHGTEEGISVATLLATHTGIGDNPDISYEIVGNDNEDTLRVEDNTLKTNKPIDFYILNGSYTFRLRAIHRAISGFVVEREVLFRFSVLRPKPPLLGAHRFGSDLRLYPNPAKQYIVLLFQPYPEQVIQVALFSATGNLIRHYRQVTDSGSLRLTLPQGLSDSHYFVRVESEYFRTTKQIMKQIILGQ